MSKGESIYKASNKQESLIVPYKTENLAEYLFQLLNQAH